MRRSSADELHSRPWPRGCKGAVSLTFDDGMESHLHIALPLLEKYGLKATFYLIAGGEDWRAKLGRWNVAAQDGHELGNHTTRHLCSNQRSGVPAGPDNLEGVDLDTVEADILLAEERLRAVFGPVAHSFCYPCYQNHVGQGPTRQSYVPVVARHFTAARGLGLYGTNHPVSADLHYLWSWRCDEMNAAEMIGRAEEAAAAGHWDIFTFHGINEGHLNVTERDFERFLAHLDRRRDEIWTAPVIVVADAVRGWRAQHRAPTASF